MARRSAVALADNSDKLKYEASPLPLPRRGDSGLADFWTECFMLHYELIGLFIFGLVPPSLEGDRGRPPIATISRKRSVLMPLQAQ